MTGPRTVTEPTGRTPGAAARKMRALAVAVWNLARRRVHPVRGCATVGSLTVELLLRGVWPALAAAAQSPTWCTRWRRLVDRIVAGRVQLAAAAVAALVLWALPVTSSWTWLLLAPPCVVAVFVAARHGYPHTPRGQVRGRRDPAGWATWLEHRRHLSADAARHAALHTRPSLPQQVVGRWSGRPSAALIARLPVTQCGTWLGNTAIGSPLPTPCYAAHRDVVAVVAPPQSLKTALMGHQIIDHCGPVLSTQTKPETYHLTRTLRARHPNRGWRWPWRLLAGVLEHLPRRGRIRGLAVRTDDMVTRRLTAARPRPVHLLDPDGLTGHPSTFAWSPVRGCADPRVAQERAVALAGAVGQPGGENQHFVDRAATVLRTLLLVADVAGLSMREVYGWAASGDDGLKDAVKVMREHETRIPDGWITAITGTLTSKAEKYRGGILQILAGSVEWMSDPATAALATPADGDVEFNVARFLNENGTLYAIGDDREHATSAPFLAAFVVHFHEEAKRHAATRPGGRLDPPLMESLDEVANTIPVPLHRWVTDSGGRGIHIVFSIQSRSQLRDRWGDAGADTVWNASTTKLIAGGLTVSADLRDISELAGTRPQPGTDRDEPLLPPIQVRLLPRWHALLIARLAAATIVKVWPVWLRPDVIAARLAPAPAPAPLALTVADTVPEEWTREVAAR